MNKHLKITNDLVFQRIFGKVGNEEITKHFLEKILRLQIEELSLDLNKRLIGEAIDDKIGRLDVRAKLSDGTNLLIEMQVAKYKSIAERVLYYWAKIYAGDLKQGNTYAKLHKTIAILISTQTLEQTKGLENYHTTWHIREDTNFDKVLTQNLEMHVLELNKFKEGKENPENDWIKFILGENMGIKEDFEKEVQEAIKELEELEKDPEMRELYLRREMALHDRATEIEEAEEAAIERGMKKRDWTAELNKGLNSGIEQKAKEVVLNLYNKKMDIQDICDIVNLPKEKVEKIINDIK